MSTIADNIYAQLGSDTGPIDALADDPLPAESKSREHPDLDERDYALAFGMAWAMARAEQPFANDEDVARLAREAATQALRWFGTVGGKEAALAEAAA